MKFLITLFIFGLLPVKAEEPLLGFTSGFTGAQRQMLLADLEFAKTIELSAQDSELANAFEIPEGKKLGLQSWISKRVRYLMDPSVSPEAKNVVLVHKEKFQYPEADVKTFLDIDMEHEDGFFSATSADDGFLLLNVGAAVYKMGKDRKQLLVLNLPGVGPVPMRSPRAGVVQISAGKLLDKDDSEKYARLKRIHFLAHEARHSDGHGQSLGFIHARCPEGHDLDGIHACDKNLNGPYSLQGLIIKKMISDCADCSTKDKEKLRLQRLDVLSRVLKTWKDHNGKTEKAVAWDAKPEGTP